MIDRVTAVLLIIVIIVGFFVFFFTIELVKVVLSLDKETKEFAQKLYKHKSIIVMGRGFNYATCLEGALVSVMNN